MRGKKKVFAVDDRNVPLGNSGDILGVYVPAAKWRTASSGTSMTGWCQETHGVVVVTKYGELYHSMGFPAFATEKAARKVGDNTD